MKPLSHYSDLQWERLHNLHSALAVLHGASAMVMLIVTLSVGSHSVNLVVTHWDRAGTIHPEHLVTLPVEALCILFLALAFLDHLATIVRWHAFKVAFEKGESPLRWFEYSFSFPVMSLVIAIECGGNDLWTLALVWILSLVVIQARASKPWSWAAFGCLWAVFATLIAFAPGAPGFVWAILTVLFVCELAFGAIDLFVTNYLLQEVAYCMLSLVAKSSLAWITFGGTRSL